MDMYRLRIVYSKKGVARFISNKNLCKLIERSLRRVDTPFFFTAGFQPRVKISFGPPLPVYLEGIKEGFDLYTERRFDTATFLSAANKVLCEGLCFLSARWVELGGHALNAENLRAVYRIKHNKGSSGQGLVDTSNLQGAAVKRREGFSELTVLLRDFKHKGLVELLKQGKIEGIEREIIWEENG